MEISSFHQWKHSSMTNTMLKQQISGYVKKQHFWGSGVVWIVFGPKSNRRSESLCCLATASKPSSREDLHGRMDRNSSYSKNLWTLWMRISDKLLFKTNYLLSANKSLKSDRFLLHCLSIFNLNLSTENPFPPLCCPWNYQVEQTPSSYATWHCYFVNMSIHWLGEWFPIVFTQHNRKHRQASWQRPHDTLKAHRPSFRTPSLGLFASQRLEQNRSPQIHHATQAP